MFASSSSRISRVVLVACCVAVQACAPIVTHGPQVRPGGSGGISVSVGGGPTYENGDDPGPYPFGGAVLHAAYGFRPASPREPALRVGFQMPTYGWSAADVYVQAPRAWLGSSSAAGVGLLAEGSGRVMPYVQAGVANAAGAGVDVVAGAYTFRWGGIGYDVYERAGLGWLSAQLPLARWLTARGHVGFARGHVRKYSQGSAEPWLDENRWVKLSGLTLEVHGTRR